MKYPDYKSNMLILFILLLVMIPAGCVPVTTAAPTGLPSISPTDEKATETPVPTGTIPYQQMTTRCVDIREPLVADYPSGQIVLFYQSSAGGGSYLLDLSSQTRMLFSAEGAMYETVSPDGKLLAYNDVDNKSVVVMDADGQHVTEIPDPDEYLTPVGWLDNERLMVDKRRGERGNFMAPLPSLILFNPLTGEQQEWLPDYPNLYDDSNLRWGMMNHFVLNSELTYLVYPTWGEGGPLVLWNVEEGRDVSRLYFGSSREPHFSPDGDRVVASAPPQYDGLVNIYDGLPTVGGEELFLMGINGDLTRLTYFTTTSIVEQRDFAWSPDGKQIAFFLRIVGEGSDEYQLAVISLETRQVVNYCIPGLRPMWSPDGKHLLVNQDYDTGGEIFGAYLIRLEDGATWLLAKDAQASGWMVESNGPPPTP